MSEKEEKLSAYEELVKKCERFLTNGLVGKNQ